MDYKEKQMELIKQYNVTLDEHSSCWNRTHAHCDGSRRICKHIPANSYKSLFTLLHEIGHLETDKKGMKRCEQESEATRWAVEQLRGMGLKIKQSILKRYKEYTRMTYDRGMRRGLSKKVKSKLYM